MSVGSCPALEDNEALTLLEEIGFLFKGYGIYYETFYRFASSMHQKVWMLNRFEKSDIIWKLFDLPCLNE